MEPLRLQKYFSMCGAMSRRAAEEEINAGHVLVNGLPASLGDKVDPETDTVVWRGKELHLPKAAVHTYLVLNKPAGYVTTMQDEKGRKTAVSLLPAETPRVYPVGRLDMFSDGLLLFTDDGELTNKLTHPSHHITKTYRLTLKGKLTADDAKRFEMPMELDGYRLRPVEARFLENGLNVGGADASVFEITLHEGRNRQIRRMCEQLGYTVIRLTRIAIGPITLGHLPLGKTRPLTEEEIKALRTMTETEGTDT